MEKRFVFFIVMSTGMMLAYITLNNFLMPPRPPQPAAGQADDLAQKDQPKAGKPAGDAAPPAANGDADAKQPASDQPAGDQPTDTEPNTPEIKGPEGPAEPPTPAAIPRQWITLGRFDSNQPYRLLAVLTNRGAAVERLELVERTAQGRFRYRDLDDSSGYLGYLALIDETPARCRVHVVPPGSPAALATCSDAAAGIGLQAGDVISRVGTTAIQARADVAAALSQTKANQTIEIEVVRPGVGKLLYTATLTERPLALIGSESPHGNGPGPNPPSFRVALQAPLVLEGTVRDLMTDPGLATLDWEVAASDASSVEFRLPVTDRDGQPLGCEVRKRYRLARTDGDAPTPGYHLEIDVEIRNTSDKPQSVALQWEGPNGLPSEGWWYANKIHPSFFGSAGARDLIWNAVGRGHQIRGARELYQQARGDTPNKPVFTPAGPGDLTQLRYAGIDAQYFCVAVLPKGLKENQALEVAELIPHAAGDVQSLEKARIKLTNSSFLLGTGIQALAPGASWAQQLVVFAGPKAPAVLEEYGIGDSLYLGWFPWVAKPLSAVLQSFHYVVGNYGLAIIMLTVLVRACMFPLSRKAARNAAMMQELAPELKKIAEKHKNDMEKRMQAQKELYAKYNFNPFGGCLLMFVQLPIFIGLYRCLSVDINLRQAPLIPGLDWCSNLAGPDQLWRWPLPEFLAGETGFLGPYLNILPIVTIGLFLVQQKLFTPPATDEQARMQQQMMKFMMIFIGVMFFKVPGGLCIYFIASSIWGIAERVLLPKSNLTPAEKTTHHTPSKRAADSSGNGAAGKSSKPVRKQRRRP